MSHARLKVLVTPRAGRDEIAGMSGDGVVAVRVTAPPAEGRANDAVCRVIARALGVAPTRVSIAGGAASRLKTVAVEGLDLAPAQALLRAAAPPPG
jgi:uncharacterized protein (TIGR00251 family)